MLLTCFILSSFYVFLFLFFFFFVWNVSVYKFKKIFLYQGKKNNNKKKQLSLFVTQGTEGNTIIKTSAEHAINNQ